MIRPKKCRLAGRALVVITVGTALILTYGLVREPEIISFHQWVKLIAAPVKMVGGIQVGSWRKVLLDLLADAKLFVPKREKIVTAPVVSGVRTLRLHHVHTRESLTVTYKRDGRYITSAMARLDYFLRDWRTNTVVTMSGETLDRLWELHKELGSKKPINVISGYRSSKTNALLKRRGRQVATRGEHLFGRAIDVQFPDVPLKQLRNRALARQAGGVGYYPAGNGGFIHIDSGRVRHWPNIDQAELAEILGIGRRDRDAVATF